MSPAMAEQFGDTTNTKVFVGGLAWETRSDTLKSYFDQFGEILEAVIITDKSTGRSKGYGFVTFREADAATRACVDANPVIDGRRANCNLASLGLQRSKPSPPNTKLAAAGVGAKNDTRFMSSNYQMVGYGGGMLTAAFPTSAPPPNLPYYYAFQQGIPFANYYGYSSYPPDYGSYPMNHSASVYGSYGGYSSQYPANYGAVNMNSGGGCSTFYYPYVQLGKANAGTVTPNYRRGPAANAVVGQSYTTPHHQLHLQYPNSSSIPQPYAPPFSPAPTRPLQSDMMVVALPAPSSVQRYG